MGDVTVVCDMLAAELKVTQEFGKVVVVVSGFGSVERQLCFASCILCLRECSMILLHPACV